MLFTKENWKPIAFKIAMTVHKQSAKDVGMALGVSPSYVYKLYNGSRIPNETTLKAINAYLALLQQSQQSLQ